MFLVSGVSTFGYKMLSISLSKNLGAHVSLSHNFIIHNPNLENYSVDYLESTKTDQIV